MCRGLIERINLSTLSSSCVCAMRQVIYNTVLVLVKIQAHLTKTTAQKYAKPKIVKPEKGKPGPAAIFWRISGPAANLFFHPNLLLLSRPGKSFAFLSFSAFCPSYRKAFSGISLGLLSCTGWSRWTRCGRLSSKMPLIPGTIFEEVLLAG